MIKFVEFVAKAHASLVYLAEIVANQRSDKYALHFKQ